MSYRIGGNDHFFNAKANGIQSKWANKWASGNSTQNLR